MQQPVRIAGLGFQRVAESVAEIEQRPRAARLALVFGNDAGLGLHAGGDGIFDGVAIMRDDLVAIRLAPAEEGIVAEDAVLYHFGISATHFAGR